MRLTTVHVFLLCGLLAPCLAYWRLTSSSYLKLPTAKSSRGDTYSLFGDTAVAAAYDKIHYKLYVIGSKPHLMHVIDVTHPDTPTLLLSHQFTVGEGVPRAVAVCGNELAVALSSQKETLEGHVRYYETYHGLQTDIRPTGAITVGQFPRSIAYSPDCSHLVIANEGRPGKDLSNAYYDPEGTVTIIRGEKSGNPSVQTVGFNSFNNRTDIRVPAFHIPRSTLNRITTVAEDLEPTAVSVTEDGRYAYVTLQDNDAIMKVDVNAGTASYLQSFPWKNWGNTNWVIDASDRDGGIHRRPYPSLRSLRQPGALKTLRMGRTDYIFAAEEGSSRTYSSSLHGFSWTDLSTARTLAASVDKLATTTTFQANIGNDEFLGRLQVSKIDGKDTSFQNTGYKSLLAFGGRGFSIWKDGDFTAPVFDSAGTMEEYMEAEDKSVFNTDCVTTTVTYMSPETMRDSTSNSKGPNINSLDLMTDNGTTFLVVGSKTTGMLFLYTVNTTGTAPTVTFQSVMRAGVKDLPWKDLYDDGTIGDLYISDIRFIPSSESPTDSPLLYVVSNGSGSVSIYQLEEAHSQIPLVPIG